MLLTVMLRPARSMAISFTMTATAAFVFHAHRPDVTKHQDASVDHRNVQFSEMLSVPNQFEKPRKASCQRGFCFFAVRGVPAASERYFGRIAVRPCRRQ